jgi:hypothetical protein
MFWSVFGALSQVMITAVNNTINKIICFISSPKICGFALKILVHSDWGKDYTNSTLTAIGGRILIFETPNIFRNYQAIPPEVHE